MNPLFPRFGGLVHCRTLGLVALGFILAAPARAQLRASERGTVSQTVDGTVITVSYSRPMARGRTGLFGGRIHWGETWTPGANRATTIGVSKDVTIEGRPVPRGTYSVWIEVRRGPWEMVLDRDTLLVHYQPPRARPGQIRLPITREHRPFMEGLTWWFPRVQGISTVLAMQWDTVYVPLRIRVPLSYPTEVRPEVVRRLVGVYQIHFEAEETSGDSTLHAPVDTLAPLVRLTLRGEGTELRGVMDPPMYHTEEGYREWLLVPAGEGSFILGRYLNGELVEVWREPILEFDSAGPRAEWLELRSLRDEVVGRGRRFE